MTQNVHKYFWLLDNKISKDFIDGYAEALAGRKSPDNSKLAQAVSLLQINLPMVPQVYITPRIAKHLAQSQLPKDFYQELSHVIEYFEQRAGRVLSDRERPLLLTVQNEFSGTIRNIGVSLENLRGLIHLYGAARAYTLFIDFLENYSMLVLKCPHIDFRKSFQLAESREGDGEGLEQLSEEQFAKMVNEYQALVSNRIGRSFPVSPEQHLLTSLIYCASACRITKGDEVFIKVQTELALSHNSLQGVAYTRNPFNGEKDIYGVYTSGFDKKKGVLDSQDPSEKESTLRNRFPTTFAMLQRFLPNIEKKFRGVMDVEFVTDDDGSLFFTSFNKAETTAKATVRSALSLNTDGIISDAEAIQRMKPNDLEVLLHPTLDDESRENLEDLGPRGVTAAPGTATGHVFFKMEDAMKYHEEAQKNNQKANVLLIADELLVSDTPGLGIISGLVTTASGLASHAAVMARSNGIPCVIGYKDMVINYEEGFMTIRGKKVEKGAVITLEAGDEGRLYLGEGHVKNLSFEEGIIHEASLLVSRVLKQMESPLQVRVNINNHKDAQIGLHFGADGVGLCRTENMFTQPSSIKELRTIMFSESADSCQGCFKRMEEMQTEDYRAIFKVMSGKPVYIRLMDMPLHELVPTLDSEYEELARDMGKSVEELESIAEKFKESNPMLGLRACRFGIITPEVYDMQIRAIFHAAYEVLRNGGKPIPGIMFPLVLAKGELERLRARVLHLEEEIRDELKIPFGDKIDFKVGTMTELPSACLSADKLATLSEFFAFGTNDLTQTTLGISRNDCENYLPFYIENGILPSDPFKVLATPVKELMETAVRRGRRVRKGSVFGICGEQGGDSATLEFCLSRGLNYVSCSAFRVLPTRLSLARLLIEDASHSQKVLRIKNSEARAS